MMGQLRSHADSHTCTPTKHDEDPNTLPLRKTSIMEADEELDSLPTMPKHHHHHHHHHPPKPRRPENARSCTEPTPAVLLQSWSKEKDALHDSRPSSSSSNNHHRNRSPYSRSHLRSRSTGNSALSAPPMMRAHSLPNPNLPRPFDGATSPNSGTLSPSPLRGTRSPRSRSPFKPEDTATHHYAPPRSPGWFDPHAFLSTGVSSSSIGGGIESIQEDSELYITPRGATSPALLHPQPSPSASRSSSLRGVFGSNSSARRPASPLHSQIHAHAPTSFPASVIDQNAQLHMTSGSGANSPSLPPQKYNEVYPHPSAFNLHSTHSSASSFSSFGFPLSSHPSTPSSARSRSPSISSLETIEDAPELEEEATEAEAAMMARLKLAAAAGGAGGESESDGEGEGRRRSLDAPRRRGGGGSAADGVRKRWSVCGAERRADLDLETIWED